MKNGFSHTIRACFTAYIVQAVVNNFVPLLFLTFHRTYGIPMSQITLLVTINFAIQIMVDLLSVTFVDRIGYRASMVLAHLFVSIGLIALTILPDLMGNAFIGLLLSIAIYAIGGGVLEVLVSPVMEACPSENKEAAMSMLHSFYCWGHVGVVLLSTIFFQVFGIGNWKILALIWSLLPICNAFVFTKVPIAHLIPNGESGMGLKSLLKSRIFWILFFMMFAAGSSEQAVSQWASAFAEQGLGISKTLGDLCGPLAFALLMGISRAFYGKFGSRINLDRFMIFSTLLCMASYLGIAFFPHPALSIACCAITGLSVGIMWPGTFSTASAALPSGGTAMFALLALSGDLGCGGGPTLVGLVASSLGDNLKAGILFGILFPILLLSGILLLKKDKKK